MVTTPLFALFYEVATKMTGLKILCLPGSAHEHLHLSHNSLVARKVTVQAPPIEVCYFTIVIFFTPLYICMYTSKNIILYSCESYIASFIYTAHND